ncbi:101 kDa malaria antigen-like [Megalobrama amblycephala]|nr:101 kDa malaria antigen-like [Megalobrama amblycephala]
MMYKEGNKLENMNPSQMASENARFAIEQTRAQMNKSRENYQKCVENLEKNQKELTEILVTMRNCELKEIDFKTTINMLVKGMDAMGRVKEQWEKMVHFFQMVSNIVKASLSKTLKNFASTSEKVQNLSYNAKLFSIDLLYIQAFQACNIASLVHMISGTYTDVSSKYLMDRVSSLGKLMVMDKDRPEFERERQQLQNSCDEAQKCIIKLVLKNKEEFEKNSTARQEKIDQELLAILPAAPPEEIKRIQESVQAGFTKEEEKKEKEEEKKEKEEEEASYY